MGFDEHVDSKCEDCGEPLVQFDGDWYCQNCGEELGFTLVPDTSDFVV